MEDKQAAKQALIAALNKCEDAGLDPSFPIESACRVDFNGGPGIKAVFNLQLKRFIWHLED